MKTSTVRNILIGIYVLMVLGFSAMAKAQKADFVTESAVKVSPFSH